MKLDDVRAERDEGIRVSSENAGEEWKQEAIAFVFGYLCDHPTLFVDDLWDAGLPEPSSPRALGAVIQSAKRHGWMTEFTHDGMVLARPSVRSHMSLKAVWRSRLHRG